MTKPVRFVKKRSGCCMDKEICEGSKWKLAVFNISET